MLEMRKCREWVVNRSQNMGPNYGKFFGHLGQSVTVQKVGCCLCGNLVLKCMLDMEKGREWAARSVPKHGTEIVEILETFGTAVNAQKLLWAVVWNL